MLELQILPEIEKLIDPLTSEEYMGLEENIINDGKIYDPIKTWKGYIADGHNRYRIAKEHGLTFTTEELPFDTIEELEIWVLKNQLWRRNLDPMGKAAAIGRLRDRLQEAFPDKPVTAKDIAKASGVEVTDANIRNIQRDLQSNEVYKALPPRIRQRLRDGEYSATPSSLRDLDALPEDLKENVMDMLIHADPDTIGSVGECISVVKANAKPKRLGGKDKEKDPEGLIPAANTLYSAITKRAERTGETKLAIGIEMKELARIVLEKVQRWIDSL